MDATPEEIQAAEAADTSEYMLTTDGRGIDIEIIRKMLCEEFKTYFNKSDPTLTVVPIHNAFLGELVKLNNEHTKILEKVYTKQTEQQAKNVMEAANEITKTLSAVTVQGLNDVVKDLVKFKTTLFFATAIYAVSSLVIAGALIWRP